MSEPTQGICDNCRFWLAKIVDGHPDDYGKCRRYAPRPTTTPLLDDDGLVGVSFTYWPETSFDEWCGEWVPRTSGETT